MAPVMTPVVSPMGAPMLDTWTPSVRCLRACRAGALLLRSSAVGLRALGLYSSAQLLHNSPLSRSLSSLRALAKSLPGSGFGLRTLRAAASARRKAPGGSKPRVPRPTGGLFPRFAQSYPVRQSGALRAGRKHRIGRVWGRSLRCRSLGLATASAMTGSVSAGALPSPCFAWGFASWLSGPGGPAQTFVRPGGQKSLPLLRRLRRLRAPLRWRTRKRACHCCTTGLRALALSKPNLDHTRSNRGSSRFKRLRSTDQSTTKAVQSQIKRLDKE